ncbi:MAG: hypothetical protein ABJO57_00125 [Lentilitoribacter sp.]
MTLLISGLKLGLKSALLAAAFTLSASQSHASDLIKGFYFDVDFGAGATVMTTNSSLVPVPKVFLGFTGSAELCQSNAITFDICGGVSTFQPLGTPQKISTVGSVTTTVDADMSAVNAYAKFRKRGLGFAVAPYFGLGNVKSSYKTTTLGFTTLSEKNSKVMFAGIEVERKILLTNFVISLKAEAGSAIKKSDDTKYYSFKPSIKARF